MKKYSDGINTIWFPQCFSEPQDYFSSRERDRGILRLIVKHCFEHYDPFTLIKAFCVSDYAELISRNSAKGYFYGVGKFLNDCERLGLCIDRCQDWDVAILNWIVDIYVTARFELGMSYWKIGECFPVDEVYKKFNPLHETSELNALSKMQLSKRTQCGCIINDRFYVYKSEVPLNKQYLLNYDDAAVYDHEYYHFNCSYLDKDDVVKILGLDNFYNLVSSGCCTGNEICELLNTFNFDSSELLKLKERIVYCDEDSVLGNGLKKEGYEYYNWFMHRGHNLLGNALEIYRNEISKD